MPWLKPSFSFLSRETEAQRSESHIQDGNPSVHFQEEINHSMTPAILQHSSREKMGRDVIESQSVVPAVSLTKALFWEIFPSFPAQFTPHSQDMTYCRVNVRGSQSWWSSRKWRKWKGRERCHTHLTCPPSPRNRDGTRMWEIKVT